MTRVHNFSAGPATLPLAVLERTQKELCDFDGTGMSIMEHSHRGKAYDRVHQEAMGGLRKLLSVPDDYSILLLQGGASLQFAMIPLNLLPAGKSADYVVTGAWSKKALAEANRVGQARSAWDDNSDGVYTRVPNASDLDRDPAAAYLHFTSNNTIFGTQFHDVPDSGGTALVCDMSSDFLWRPFDVSRFGLIYAGAQKNIGPSGLAVVIVKNSLIEGARTDGAAFLKYKTHADKDSLFNTPNTFAVYVVRNVLQHLDELGGLSVMEQHNREKGALLYDLIDSDADFFRSPVDRASRSLMNIVFRLPSEELEARFLSEATDKQLVGLKGHRSVGGIRASIYNACTTESVSVLADFMKSFRKSA